VHCTSAAVLTLRLYETLAGRREMLASGGSEVSMAEMHVTAAAVGIMLRPPLPPSFPQNPRSVLQGNPTK
jgi:hypothetical protein